MQTTPQPDHLRWVDVVRALGAFLVVLAHVNFRTNASPWIESFYYILSRIAVPTFFMASGYLLLSKEEPYGVFFRKRALRVIIPFLAWSVIYMLWKREGFDQPFSLELVARYALKIIRGPRENHLWFFYSLIGLYLFTPILRVFAARASIRDLAYFCGLWFVVMPVLFTLEEFTPIVSGFELYMVAGYTGYYVLGHLIGRIQFQRAHLYVIAALFLIVWLVTVQIEYINAIRNNHTQYFEDYFSLDVVLMSIFAFVLLREVAIGDRLHQALVPLSKASFGVYLIHIIVIAIMLQIPAVSDWVSLGSPIYVIPLFAIAAFVVSFVLTYIIQRLPVLRAIVP